MPYFTKLFNDSADLDPEKRPRTFTLNEDDTFETSKCLKFPDFYLLNRYPGWYHKWGYEISDGEAGLRAELDEWKNSDIDKPIVFSEYGADTEPGLHKLPSIMWSEEYQIELLEMFNRVFDSYDFIRGEQLGIWPTSKRLRATCGLTVIRKESLPEIGNPSSCLLSAEAVE